METRLLPLLRRSRRHLGAGLLVVLAATGLLVGMSARAEPATDPARLVDGLGAQLQTLALEASRQAVPGVSRVEIEVGELNPRLQLAACQQVQPYLPPGTRLWGRSRIGLRCTEGARPWNVYLPIRVKVYGPALVATAALPAGHVLGPQDLAQDQADLADDMAAVVTDSELAVGRVLLRNLAPGDALRQNQLKARQWFSAGEVVKVVVVGAGFAVSSSGQALSHGLEGQSVRVRTESGRILTGRATGDRLLEVML